MLLLRASLKEAGVGFTEPDCKFRVREDLEWEGVVGEWVDLWAGLAGEWELGAVFWREIELFGEERASLFWW